MRRLSEEARTLSNKRMQLTKLRAAPVRRAEVPPCAPAGRTDGGTASQLIRSVRRTIAAATWQLTRGGHRARRGVRCAVGVGCVLTQTSDAEGTGRVTLDGRPGHTAERSGSPLRAALVLLAVLLVAFMVLAQVAEHSLGATALLSLLIYPGLVLQVAVTGDPHSVGAFVMVSAFVIDYCLALGVLAAVRRRGRRK